jgi:hypothetical protein
MMFRLSFFLLTSWMAAAASAATAEHEETAATLHFLAPHPLAGLEVDADTAAAAMLGHYGKPPADCEGDEKAFQISGVPGMVRSVIVRSMRHNMV